MKIFISAILFSSVYALPPLPEWSVLKFWTENENRIIENEQCRASWTLFHGCELRDVANCKVGSATEVWDWDTFSCHCFCVVEE
ncbi:unnamed protein product [Oikopleura dioica]|uniref:Uncharacterized protein n=1 Tax=Oikopleura dioica TaxID=34765 RepID=E4Y4C3_OIKDI|nr:unnamed protein product [Oikopleura dioica]